MSNVIDMLQWIDSRKNTSSRAYHSFTQHAAWRELVAEKGLAKAQEVSASVASMLYVMSIPCQVISITNVDNRKAV